MQFSTFETGFLNGRIVISFPESAAPAAERNDFITFLKMERIARQCRFSGKDAKALAEEVDSTW